MPSVSIFAVWLHLLTFHHTLGQHFRTLYIFADFPLQTFSAFSHLLNLCWLFIAPSVSISKLCISLLTFHFSYFQHFRSCTTFADFSPHLRSAFPQFTRICWLPASDIFSIFAIAQLCWLSAYHNVSISRRQAFCATHHTSSSIIYNNIKMLTHKKLPAGTILKIRSNRQFKK